MTLHMKHEAKIRILHHLGRLISLYSSSADDEGEIPYVAIPDA
jgi:hypothetical protein